MRRVACTYESPTRIPDSVSQNWAMALTGHTDEVAPPLLAPFRVLSRHRHGPALNAHRPYCELEA
eukprot:scaffold135432_cov39-Tisochrysis_lutea.AAC.2